MICIFKHLPTSLALARQLASIVSIFVELFTVTYHMHVAELPDQAMANWFLYAHSQSSGMQPWCNQLCIHFDIMDDVNG